jgi:hypothetical protein
MASYNYTFTSGDTVTPTKLNSARTVSEIVNADIKSDAAIALSKLATGALPAAITVASDNLVDGTIVNADINASAAIAGTKVDPNFGSQNVTTTGVGTFSILDIRRGDPRVQINETDASTNNKQWDILADNEGMFIRAVNDAYNAAGNAIEIQRSGTTIDSVSMPNGNVNIGTSSSTSKLTVVDNSANDAVRITQTGSGNALVVEDSANPDATPFVVTADGSVGIGTVPLPGVKLEVVGGIRSALLNIIDGAAATYRFLALNTNNVARWHVGTDNDAESGSNAGSNFFMHRWSDNGTFLERVLHISRSTGNVGINTSSPTERLEVSGTVKATAFSGPLTGTASAIADGSVSTAKIVDANVTNAKLASDIDASKLTTGTLPIARIADDSVTDAKLSLAANAGEIKKALNADNDPPIFACRAWVNFDGTKNTAGEASTANTNRLIRASGNVTSVLRNGTGDYTITFTTAMPDANYSITGASANGTTSISVSVLEPLDSATARTASSFRVGTSAINATTNRTPSDVGVVSIAIFR